MTLERLEQRLVEPVTPPPTPVLINSGLNPYASPYSPVGLFVSAPCSSPIGTIKPTMVPEPDIMTTKIFIHDQNNKYFAPLPELEEINHNNSKRLNIFKSFKLDELELGDTTISSKRQLGEREAMTEIKQVKKQKKATAIIILSNSITNYRL